MRNLRDVVALKKASSRHLSASDPRVHVEHRAGRGRCVFAAVLIPAGTAIDEVSGPALAACLLRSNGSRCEHCFCDLSASSPIVCACPRGCGATYCSQKCRHDDFIKWDHERAFAAELTLGAHAKQSEDLSAEALPESLDRFGTLLLAVRLLWMRHQICEGKERVADSGLRVTADEDEDDVCRLLDELAEGPIVSDDLELAAIAATTAGFLPPHVSPTHVVSMIGSVRVNCAAFTDSAGLIIGVGLYPKQARLNHSCWPNCVLSYGARGAVRVRTLRDVGVGEEMLITYTDPSTPTEERRAVLQQRWGFVCECSRCTCSSEGTDPYSTSDVENLLEAAHRAQLREASST